MTLRLGFFTRVLDDADAARRYRLATEQIAHAEALGFDTAWVAQHHFHEWEGGLPAPMVFLAHVAAQTTRIRLGTGIVTLPLENPVRAAEDAVVLDLLSGGRLEFGVGPGGTASAFAAFGQDAAARAAIFDRHLATVRDAWAGAPLGGSRLYPAAGSLGRRVWQATFSVEGGARAGLAGDGLMLSRTQPRPPERPDATLAAIQAPIIDAYLAALPSGVAPRILASRSVFVGDDRAEVLHWAERGLRRHLAHLPHGHPDRVLRDAPLGRIVAAVDMHLGTPEAVVCSLADDATLARCTDLTVQVHSADPPHGLTLRSLELVARQVAPKLGWRSAAAAPADAGPMSRDVQPATLAAHAGSVSVCVPCASDRTPVGRVEPAATARRPSSNGLPRGSGGLHPPYAAPASD